MTILQSIFLGILQGVAEFLPVSSSGHLAVARKLFGLEEVPLLFDVILHLATLLAVCIFFRKKIFSLLCIFARVIFPKKNLSEEEVSVQTEGRRYIVAIIAATVVTGAIGIFTSKIISNANLKLVCSGFIITADFLVLSSLYEKYHKKKDEAATESEAVEKAPGLIQSLIIGFAQGIGTLPGISRSGSTLTCALLIGNDKKQALDFSFLMSIPIILASAIYESFKLFNSQITINWTSILTVMISSFIFGILSIKIMLKLVNKNKLFYFSFYLIALSLLVLLV